MVGRLGGQHRRSDMLNGAATVEAIATRIDAPLLGWVPRLPAAGTTTMAAAALEYLDFSGLLPVSSRDTPATHSTNAKEI